MASGGTAHDIEVQKPQITEENQIKPGEKVQNGP
jgi:hypothetical protein